MTRALLLFILIAALSLKAELPPKAASIASEHRAALADERHLQIQCALGAFNSLKARQVIYVSCPITSGQRLYDYMEEHGYATIEDAKKDGSAFFQHVVLPNTEASERVSHRLSQETDGAIIAPTAFERGHHNKRNASWGQHEFMHMWLSMIEHKATQIVMVDGWQYSSGSTEEYLWAVLMQMGFVSRSGIEVVDERGDTLTLSDGIRLIYDACLRLQSKGLQSKSLAAALAALLEAEQLYSDLDAPSAQLPPYNHAEIQSIAKF